MSDQTELRRVLAELDNRTDPYEHGPSPQVAADAARLLRALARDFERLAVHGGHTSIEHPGSGCVRDVQPFQKHLRCECGLDAARERWRLE